MSDSQNMGFGKFVPGFDFLQNLAKGAAQGGSPTPHLSSWVAPTLSVEELDKRISELKAVSFWLDQNAKALAATIQALEVQKMTLATFKGMNLAMGDLAEAMKLKPAAMAAAMSKAAAPPQPAAAGAPAAETPAAARTPGKGRQNAGAGAGTSTQAASAGVIDPMQWWGALTQQFQAIAGEALKDVARQSQAGPAASMAGAAQDAMKAAGSMAEAVMAPATGAKARKAAPKKSATAKRATRSR